MRKVFLIISFFLFLNASSNNSTLQKANYLYSKKNYKKAFKLYKSIDNVVAKNDLAMMYYYGYGTRPDQAKAVAILEELLKKKLSKKENSIILYNLGMMYYYGYVNNFTQKLIVNRSKAEKLIKESANLGYKPAKNFYNKIYKSLKDINASKKK